MKTKRELLLSKPRDYFLLLFRFDFSFAVEGEEQLVRVGRQLNLLRKN